MIDPFFLDRLMHVFTTAHATPHSQTAAPDRRGEPGANSGVPSVPPRVVAEAAAVAAAALREGRATHAATKTNGGQA